MQNKKGFTLIELLIVVVIIGILAAIAIPKFSATRERAYYSALRADLRNLATQQEIYYSDSYEYSDVLDDLSFVPSAQVVVTIGEATGTGWSAEATHPGLGTGMGCAVAHGDATLVDAPGGSGSAADHGVIYCADTN